MRSPACKWSRRLSVLTHELRAVEVIEEKDYGDQKIRTIRKDTGEVVSIKPMELDDFQEEIFGEDRHRGKIAYLGERP